MTKYYLWVLLGLAGSFMAFSQELQLESGKAFTSFKFEDSNAAALENLQNSYHDYYSISYRGNIVGDRLGVLAGVSLNTYGALGSDDGVGNFFEWRATYIGIAAGLEAEVVHLGNFALALQGTVSPEFLIDGNQTLNNQVFDITEVEDFDTPMLTLGSGASLRYSVTEKFALALSYRYSHSWQFDKNEKLASLEFDAHKIGLAIIVNLTNNENK